MKYLNNLYYLYIAYNFLTSIGVNSIISNLTYLPELVVLDLSSNEMKDDSVIYLSKHLKYISNLTFLNIGCIYITNILLVCEISDRGFMSLCENLSSVTSLMKLCCDCIYIYVIFIVLDNKISDDGFDSLIKHKSDLLNLEYIGLYNNRIKSSTIAKIETAFPHVILLDYSDEDEELFFDDDDNNINENNNNNNNNNSYNNYGSYQYIPYSICRLFCLNALNK